MERPDNVKYYGMFSAIRFVVREEMLTRGRKMIETISSSFSVSAMARPPSRGTMIPLKNAPVTDVCVSYLELSQDKRHEPKIAWTPMTSVKKADPNNSSIVKVMNIIVGPFSTEPVLWANQSISRETTKRRNKAYPTHVSKM